MITDRRARLVDVVDDGAGERGLPRLLEGARGTRPRDGRTQEQRPG